MSSYASARAVFACALILALQAIPRTAGTQPVGAERPDSTTSEAPAGTQPTVLDSFVVRALGANPMIRAASARASAARQRLAPAGTWQDPMLMAGLINQPFALEKRDPSNAGPRADMMTMRMIGVTQRVPYPGKLAANRRVAEAMRQEADAGFEQTRRTVTRDVKDTYYELAFLDLALEVVERHRIVLGDVIAATEARYAVGTAEQAEVLQARVDAAALGDQAASLHERRQTAAARLTALVGGGVAAPGHATLPDRLVRSAIPQPVERIRFVSAAFGARAADSPLPPLEALQEQALTANAGLSARRAGIRAAEARAALAGRAALPDLDLSLQYGQRSGRPDMISATVAAPIPIFKWRKQNREVAAARDELTAARADSTAAANDVLVEVAAAYNEAERERTRLALFAKAVIPQAQAALTSAAGSFQAGRVQFRTLLTARAALFQYEADYATALTEYAKAIARLEQLVGREVL